MSGDRAIDADAFTGVLGEVRRITGLTDDQLAGYTVDELMAAARHLRALAHSSRAASKRLDKLTATRSTST